MKKTSHKELATADIIEKIHAEQEKVRTSTFNYGMTRQKNVKEGRESKKLIAQLLTELKGRESKN
jgi:hypothetical protein